MRWMSCSQCRAGNAAMTTIGTSHCTCKRSLFRAHQSLQNHWAVHHTEASGCIGKLPAVQRIESCSRQLNGQFQAPFSPVVTKQISTRCRRRSTTRRSNRRKDQRVSLEPLPQLRNRHTCVALCTILRWAPTMLIGNKCIASPRPPSDAVYIASHPLADKATHSTIKRSFLHEATM